MAAKGHQQLVRAYQWDSGYLPGPAVTCAFYWDLQPAKASDPWSGSSSVDPAAVVDSDLDCLSPSSVDAPVVDPAVAGSGCKHCSVAYSEASCPAAVVAAFAAAVDAAIVVVAVTAAAGVAVDSVVDHIGFQAAVVVAGEQLAVVVVNAESAVAAGLASAAVAAYSGCCIESAAVAGADCHTGCYQAVVDYSHSIVNLDFDYFLVAVGY